MPNVIVKMMKGDDQTKQEEKEENVTYMKLFCFGLFSYQPTFPLWDLQGQ